MTLVLVALCIVVGGLELYVGRRSKDQADVFVQRINELREQVGKQNGVLATVGERLSDELSRVKRDVLPGLDTRLRQNSGQIEQLGAMLQQADEYIRVQAARLHELEKQKITLSAVRRKLLEIEASIGPVEENDGTMSRIAELERNGVQMLELQRDLTRTLEEVEDVVTGLLEFTSVELDDSVATALNGRPPATIMVAGRLWSRDPQLRDIIAEVYEQCVRANRLSIRFRAEDGERLRYFLSGRSLEELTGGFTALLISIGMEVPRPPGRPAPGDEAALLMMLRTLHESAGATVQIGPLIAVRTSGELVAAVLTQSQGMVVENDVSFWDPAAAAMHLRRLPSHQVWDLTGWAGRPPGT
jgi:hypothetical protein